MPFDSSSFYLVAYDSPNLKRRNKIASTLENFGIRVQFSLFECRLSHAEFKNLYATLSLFITSEDSVRIYPICDKCVTKILRKGPVPPLDIFEKTCYI